MLDPLGLIVKYRGRAVLVDTNLLVLLVVGLVSRDRIASFKRTDAYTPEDFDLLRTVVGNFGRIIATPHVLAEVSNLTDLPGRHLAAARAVLKALVVEEIDEICDPSAVVVEDASFARLGLTDAAIATVCERGTLVLTADLGLHGALQSRSLDSVNFNHLRTFLI